MTVQTWTIKEIIEHAKKHSPYYRELYLDLEYEKLSDLPITDQVKFWKSEVVTDSKSGGIVFKSGGSTGAPKYSYFTLKEWQTFTDLFGNGMAKGILENHDRVANLFYVGDLYASFLFIKDSLQGISDDTKKLVQFPIAGATESKQILKTLEEFQINVLLGVPSAILTLLENYELHIETYKNIKIEKILFGGESLYPDQAMAMRKIIPNVQIASIGYASVDAGLLGYCDLTCFEGEHRVFDGANIIEIVDPDTFEVITEMNRPGKVLITNLTRKLMPIIRYPAGDLAMWIESTETPNRKYKLLGRSDEAARVGTLSVYFEDTRLLVMKALSEFTGIQFQMVLNHFDHLDQLVLKVAGHNLLESTELTNRILKSFVNEKPVYKEILAKKLIHPLKIEIIDMDSLSKNERTGKLKRVIDNRN